MDRYKTGRQDASPLRQAGRPPLRFRPVSSGYLNAECGTRSAEWVNGPVRVTGLVWAGVAGWNSGKLA